MGITESIFTRSNNLILHLYKIRTAKLQEFPTNLDNLDQQLVACPSPSLTKDRVDLQTEFDLTTTIEAERLLLRSRSKY